MTAYPAWFTRTLTWDNGSEMARHARITAQSGISVYFADPHSPWQRGSNENTNGLLREYLPKGTDLSQHTAAQLQAIEDELNDRPRKRLGYRTPREELAKLLHDEQQRVATTP
jgi:IS30 family transposase